MARLTREPIDLATLTASVAASSCGGITTFVGVVRDHDDGRPVLALEYDAWPEMAEQELERIVQTAHERWPECRVAVAHRLGLLHVGEASVAVVVAAPHRDAAFAACRYTLDALKADVPIWKKEHGQVGADWKRVPG